MCIRIAPSLRHMQLLRELWARDARRQDPSAPSSGHRKSLPGGREKTLRRGPPFVAVHAALDTANRVGSADPGLVAIKARRIAEGRGATGSPVGPNGRACAGSTGTPRS